MRLSFWKKSCALRRCGFMAGCRALPLLLAAWMGAGCDLIEYHPYDTRVDGATDINARNCARIEEACAGRRTFRFAVISDTQRWYDQTRLAVQAIVARDDVDFVIHCGDLSDYGLTKEFLWQRDILEELDVPYVCLLGNHDCLGTGEATFRKVFGDPDFAFTAGTTRFVCLNTNYWECLDRVPDFGFLAAELAALDPATEHTIGVMHVRPYVEGFDNERAEPFQKALRVFPGLLCCLHGHEHSFSRQDLFGDGILYYGCCCIEKRHYYLFTVTEEGYDYEEVEF